MPEQVEVSNPPPVKIIMDGKPVDTSAIDDYDSFMSYLMEASIAANTVRLRKLEEDRQSQGEIQPITLNVTETIEEIPVHPSQSLYLENNGPGQIFVTINSPNRTPTPVPATRAVYFPFDNHIINSFCVWTAPGTTATGIAILKY